jgi:predicted peptidase
MKSIFLASVCALIFSLSANPALSQVAEMQKPKKFKRTVKKTLTAEYLLFLPKDYRAKGGQSWPLMLFLHGAGERGTNIQKVTVHGPPKLVKNRPDFPFIVVSPQCPDGEMWSNETLLALLDEVIAKHKVDTNRIYLTGLSMGGYGTWSLALQYPERFAAIAPICGGGEPVRLMLTSKKKLAAVKSLGIWVFHGAKDPVVELAESQRMVDALKKAGVQEVEFTIYPEAQHDSWTESYNNEKLYEWFLRHERRADAYSGR